MKQFLKQILSLCHIAVTRNQKYDALTNRIIRSVLNPTSNCIDIGCHRGEILDLLIRHAPSGRKIGFEPIPELYRSLVGKYAGDPLITIYPTALYDRTGSTTFQHVVNAPAYSGIKKRRYDGKEVDIDQITVETGLLDHFIPADMQIDFIKIDVEGAEFNVIKGGVTTLRRCRPVIIFEFGLGAADFYGTKPEELHRFLISECGMLISTLSGYLRNDRGLTETVFCNMFQTGSEYYFVAHR